MNNINISNVLDEITVELSQMKGEGAVASYIPELRNVDSNKLGLYVTTVDQEQYACGDYDDKFSIQSIAKALSLTLAFEVEGENLWQRVGIEPSGSAFNSLVQLEYEQGKPRNPFINAGAIVVCDVLVSHFKDAKFELLQFIRRISSNPTLSYNVKVAESEKTSGYRNYALINLMKDFGNIKNNIDVVLEVYFYLCSIEMTCKELAETFLFLACDGINPQTNDVITTIGKTKRINAIMQLCGFYDEAGEFSFKVGLPGKSGVGGGIIAIHPGKYSIAVWSPKLNDKGNSYKGMKALEMFTTKMQSSIF